MKPEIHPDSYIASNSVIIGDVTIEKGVSVWYGVVIRGDLAPIRIGKNSNIQDNAVIHVSKDAPVEIGENVTIGHGAIIHGAKIMDNVLIGMGAVILNNAVIEEGCVISAQSIIMMNEKIPEKCLVVGIPGKIIKGNSKEIEKMAKENGVSYQKLRDKYINNEFQDNHEEK